MPVVRRRALSTAVVVAIYLALGLSPTGQYSRVSPIGCSDRRRITRCRPGSLAGFLTIAHGLNPFFTNSMFVPTGVNLAQNTASPLLGLIGSPLTEAFSPLVSTNVLMVLAMPISATAAFVVFLKWNVWLPGAALGGLAYGFSPYMVGQGTAHVVFTSRQFHPSLH